MGIRVAHQPVAAPMIAAYATGVGQAQRRERERRQEMLQRYDEMRQRTAAQFQRDAIGRQHDVNMAKMQDQMYEKRDTRRLKNKMDILDKRHEQYRDADEFDQLLGDIEGREELVRGLELSQEGKKLWFGSGSKPGLMKELQMVRGTKDQFRPEVYRARLRHWVSRFDEANIPSHSVDPETTESYMAKDAVFFDSSGRRIIGEDLIEGKAGDAATVVLPDGRGGYRVSTLGRDSGKQEPEKKAFADMSYEEFLSDSDEYDRTLKQAQASLAAEAPKEGDAGITWEKIQQRMEDIFRQRQGGRRDEKGQPEPGLGQQSARSNSINRSFERDQREQLPQGSGFHVNDPQQLKAAADSVLMQLAEKYPGGPETITDDNDAEQYNKATRTLANLMGR